MTLFLKLLRKHDQVIRNRKMPIKLRWIVCERLINAMIKDHLVTAVLKDSTP